MLFVYQVLLSELLTYYYKLIKKCKVEMTTQKYGICILQLWYHFEILLADSIIRRSIETLLQVDRNSEIYVWEKD